MKKSDLEVGGLYEHNGSLIMVTNIVGDRVYTSDIDVDEDGVPSPVGISNCLTDYEVKRLKQV